MKRILAAVLWVPLACDVNGMAVQGSDGTPQPAMVLTATPANRYRVILKDGTQYTTREPYRVQGSTAVFVLYPGQLVVSVPLERVDQQATQAANAPRPTPPVAPTVQQRRGAAELADVAGQIKLVVKSPIVQVRPARVTEIGSSPAAPDLQTFAGRGHDVSGLFTLGPGLYVFQLRHSGERNFIVQLMDQTGRTIEYLVNEIGEFSGSKAVRIEKAGEYLLNIDADGEWSVALAKPDKHSTIPAQAVPRSRAVPSAPPARAAPPVLPPQPEFFVTNSHQDVTRFSWTSWSVEVRGVVKNFGDGDGLCELLIVGYVGEGRDRRPSDVRKVLTEPYRIPAGGEASFETSFYNGSTDLEIDVFTPKIDSLGKPWVKQATFKVR